MFRKLFTGMGLLAILSGTSTLNAEDMTNLMPNPGAEEVSASDNHPVKWGCIHENGNYSWGVTDKEFHGGIRSTFLKIESLKPENKGQNTGFALCLGNESGLNGKNALKALPGTDSYYISFWIKGDIPRLWAKLIEWTPGNTGSPSNRADIPMVASSSNEIGTEGILKPGTEWTKYEGIFVLKKSTGTFAVMLQADLTPEEAVPGLTFYVDDIEIKQQKTEKPKYEALTFESVWQLKDLPLKLAQREEKIINVPMIPKKEGYRITLKLQCRVNTAKFGGWNYNLSIYVDNSPITVFTPFDEFRVLNRHRVFSESEKYTVMTLSDYNLLTIFSDNFENIDPRIKVDRNEKYWYLIDINDLVTPLLNKTILTLVNRTVFSREKKEKNEIGYAIIGACEIGYVNEKELVKKDDAAFVKRPPVKGMLIEQKNFSVTLSSDGGMGIKIGDEEYFVEGAFSYPKSGMNRLLCDTPEKNNWKVNISANDAKKHIISAQCKDYKLERTMTVDETKINIEDSFRNLTEDVLGIKVDNIISANAVSDKIYLSGVDGSVGEHLCAENPTVFMKQKKSGLGVVIEDDVYRLQLKTKVKNSSVHCCTDNFGLKPRESYTMQWTIYPRYKSPSEREAPLKPFAETPDYWDFINQVRRDWNVNFTIPGNWGGDDEGRRKIFFGGLTWFRSNGAFNGKCYEMTREEYKEYYKGKMINPDLKYIPGLEPWEFVMQESEAEKFRDSLIIDKDGKMVVNSDQSDRWLTQELRDKKYHVYSAFLTKDNSWFKKRMDDISFLLNDVETDGIYLDCFNYFRFLRYNYGEWDGRTVDIAPVDFTVTRKYSDLALVVSPAEEEMVKYTLARGKYFVANTQPVTRVMNNLKTFRFVETWNSYSRVCNQAHLYTPIGLGYPGYYAKSIYGRGIVSSEWLLNDVKGVLSAGCLYFYRSVRLRDEEKYAYEALDRMYPFTPIEIHAGWLWGKERIITTKSGVFGWHDKSRVNIYLFDKNGKKIPPYFKTIETGNETATQIDIKPGEMAILERL